MQYPPHKSPSIVARYYPVIRKALDKFPEPYWFKPHPSVNFNTTVARLRDTRKGLLDYVYPGIRFSFDERDQLNQFIISVNAGSIGVGTRSALREITPVVEESTDLSDRQLPLGEPTQEVLDAACVLLKACYYDGVTINNTHPVIIPDEFEQINLGKETLIYVG